MSLKARLRIAISTLMILVVSALSLLYMRSFLTAAFERTTEVADAIVGQVESATIAVLQSSTKSVSPQPATRDEFKSAWTATIEKDPAITAALRRALENWKLIAEVYIAGDDGRILASTDPARVGQKAGTAANFAAWKTRSFAANIRQVFFTGENSERIEPLAMVGDSKPLVTAHIVLSSAFLRESLRPLLDDLRSVFLISLVVSVILAILLPGLVLDPLERLTRRLDLMATGDGAGVKPPVKREAKEFAAVYSKLELLGQRFQGARDSADELRTNVEQLLDRMEQAVLLVDHSGRLMMAGSNVGRMLGAPEGSLSGLMLADLFPASAEAQRLFSDLLTSKTPVRNRVISFRTPVGERSVSLTVEPVLRGPEQRSIGTLILMKDAETRGEIEAELGVAERLSALGQLTRGVAHEIKNPLNAITLHLEILRGRMEDAAPELDVILREIERLDRVVKTFLDFNRPVEPQRRPVDLAELARDLGKLVAPQAAAKGIEVQLDCDEPAMIEGDRDLLKQAVLNVIMNGIEAMSGGGTLAVATSRSGGLSRLTVSDTGPGIPPEARDRIFSLYFSTKPRGSGIGLAMAFRFVQLHNGNLEFTSEVNAGTRFSFTFPEAISSSRNILAISRTHGA